MLTRANIYLLAAHAHRSHRTVERLYEGDPRVQSIAREAIAAAAEQLGIEMPPPPRAQEAA